MLDPTAHQAGHGVPQEKDEGVLGNHVELGIVLYLTDGDDDDAGAAAEHPRTETGQQWSVRSHWSQEEYS